MIQDRDLLMCNLSKFFKNGSNLTVAMPLIKGESHMSLRLVDWFVTNYSKTRQVVTCKPNSDTMVNVHRSYQTQLQAYSKHQFDPFRRHERITFQYGEDERESLQTTVGQLNFLKWAIETGIIDYISENKEDIERDMASSGRSRGSKTKQEGGDRCRQTCPREGASPQPAAQAPQHQAGEPCRHRIETKVISFS